MPLVTAVTRGIYRNNPFNPIFGPFLFETTFDNENTAHTGADRMSVQFFIAITNALKV